MTRFLRQAALAFVVLLAAAAALTVVIDPYDYWGTPRIAGLNARRPAGNTHLIAVKARQYARVRPRTVVGGNSRVEVGFDPASPAWPSDARPVYNYGLAGMSFAELARQLERAVAVHRPDTILVGVDMIDFRTGEREWRAWKPPPPPPEPRLAARADMIAQVSVSLSAVGDSISAIAAQRARHATDLTFQGWEAPGGYEDTVANEGQAALFAQRNRENYLNYRTGPKAVRWPGPGGSAAWAALDRLAAVAAARHIRLIVFTYPYNADILAGFAHEGLLPAFLDLRRALAAFGAARGVAVWDFTRVSAVTTETPPPPGDRRTHMAWYWEAGHFKAALGARMTAAMLGGVADPALGEPLTPGNVDALNAALARDTAALAADPARAARLAPAFAYAERR